MLSADLNAAVTDALASPSAHPWLAANWMSTTHKYVAFMAAKAACSTIKLALQKLESPDFEFEEWWHVHSVRTLPSLADHPIEVALDALTSRAWFRFAVVRNPYDRLASGWKQKLVSDDDEGYAWLRDAIRREHGLEDQEMIPFGSSVEYLLQHGNMANDPHWVPMSATMRPDVVTYDAIGRFEDFERDFAQILLRLGAPSDIVSMAGAVTNATEHFPLASLYDVELAAQVYEHYRSDFENFAYDADSWRDV